MSVEAASFSFIGAFVDELTRVGVHHAVVSPGSRSTPLALILSEHSQMQVWLHVDERSAGFFALGMAKRMRKPVALLCTSGTAAANYLPAIVEAYYARVPLLVLTADRPHELRDVGAPQAIDQINLYGKHVKWFVEMPLAEQTEHMLRYVRTIAGRAAATALTGPSGPVHLNFPFREPLVPQIPDPPLWKGGRESEQSYVHVSPGERKLPQSEMDQLVQYLSDTEKGLIVCGPQDDPAFPPAVVQLAEALQFPILADPLSQLRSGSHDHTWVLDAYDAFLRDEHVAKKFEPDVLIRFGAMPVSKPLLRYIQHHPSCRQIIIDGDGGWMEPTLLAADMVYADPVRFCHECVKSVRTATRKTVKRNATSWGKAWQAMNLKTQETICAGQMDESRKSATSVLKPDSRQTQVENDDSPALFEGRVFMELAEWLPDGTTLFVGNSMPVRDLDTFFRNNVRRIRVLANRGANGIDGVVSSALGAGAAGEGPLVLVLGDLSFYHDLNGLLAAKLHEINATIIVINNDGGGIFSFLPQAEHGAHFEELFGTPLGLDYRSVVEMYGGSFTRVKSWAAFRQAVQHGMVGKGLSVVEVPADRRDNVRLHRVLFQSVSKALQPLLNKVWD